jgi:hypothetical protein
MIKYLALAAILFCSTAFAEVKAVIDGPKQSSPGDLIVLDGSKSVGDGHQWVIPEGIQTLACGSAGPGQLAFASGKAGTYTFALIVADKEAAIDYSTHTVTISGSLPDPKPDPDQPGPTPVPELDQLKKLSMETAARLADTVTAKSIGNAILAVEAQIDLMCNRGQRPGLDTAKAMMVSAIENTLNARPRTSLKVNWLDGWRKPIDAEIKRLNPKDVPAYRATMRAVAAGLNSVT